MKRLNKQTLMVLILGVLLVCTLIYIGIDKWNEAKEKEKLTIFQEGAQYGYEQAIYSLVEQAVKCEQVPIRFENKTINMVAVECLKQE